MTHPDPFTDNTAMDKIMSEIQRQPGSFWIISFNKRMEDRSYKGDIWELVREVGPISWLRLRYPFRTYGNVISVCTVEHDWFSIDVETLNTLRIHAEEANAIERSKS